MKHGDPNLLSLETTLEQNFPGLEILDRDLELSDRFRADLVAIEGSGRLVLVVLVEADGDEPALAALDALAFAEYNASVLAAHFEEPRLRTDQPPRVFLIAQQFPPALVTRLRPLFDSAVELFEVRCVKSSCGENVFLATVGGESQVLAASGGTSEDAFLSRLAPDQETVARHALDRVARIDDALLLSVAGSRISWTFRGNALARLELVGDRLNGSVAPNHEPRVLRSVAQVDFFVEEVLGHYVSCLGMESGLLELPDSSPPPARIQAELPAEPDTRQIDEAGNLTQAEIQAFQE